MCAVCLCGLASWCSTVPVVTYPYDSTCGCLLVLEFKVAMIASHPVLDTAAVIVVMAVVVLRDLRVDRRTELPVGTFPVAPGQTRAAHTWVDQVPVVLPVVTQLRMPATAPCDAIDVLSVSNSACDADTTIAPEAVCMCVSSHGCAVSLCLTIAECLQSDIRRRNVRISAIGSQVRQQLQ
jgi:hypothetical protein